MIQLPSPPPDPNLVRMFIPIFGMLTGVVITGMVVLGPVGRAIGDIIRHLFGAHAGGKADPMLAGDVDDLRARLDSMQHQMGELAERQDFSERLLAQVRKDRVIPGGTDVAG